MTKKTNTYRRIKTVALATRILEYLSTKKKMASLTDVSAAVEQPEATVMCHLATLRDHGFVSEVNGKYTLGMKVALMWARMKASLDSKRQEIDEQIKALEVVDG